MYLLRIPIRDDSASRPGHTPDPEAPDLDIGDGLSAPLSVTIIPPLTAGDDSDEWLTASRWHPDRAAAAHNSPLSPSPSSPPLKPGAIEALFLEPPAPAILTAWLGPAELLLDLAASTITPLENRDWVAESQAAFPPTRTGRFLIYSDYHKHKLAPGWHGIEINAGQAFGTARHGTTAGCLIALDAILKQHRPRHKQRPHPPRPGTRPAISPALIIGQNTPRPVTRAPVTRTPVTRALPTAPRRVLDLGTGSGILAIAAARALPRARIIASDFDPVAIATARENVRRNQAAAPVELVTASGLDHPALRNGHGFDLIFANLLFRTLQQIAPHLARRTRRGGMVVISGLLPHQGARISARLRALGLVKHSLLQRDDWLTGIFIRH